jgi:hypothetical protein
MSALTYYDAGRSALIQAVKIDEVKSVLNKAEAMRHYARIAGDYELESMASRLKVRAQRRIGDLSKQLEKLAPEESGGMWSGLPSSGKTSKAATLKEAGISTSQAEAA